MYLECKNMIDLLNLEHVLERKGDIDVDGDVCVGLGVVAEGRDGLLVVLLLEDHPAVVLVRLVIAVGCLITPQEKQKQSFNLCMTARPSVQRVPRQ